MVRKHRLTVFCSRHGTSAPRIATKAHGYSSCVRIAASLLMVERTAAGRLLLRVDSPSSSHPSHFHYLYSWPPCSSDAPRAPLHEQEEGRFPFLSAGYHVIVKRKRPRQCAYCEAPATTKDHVPPKGLFARPLPANLITVPSCETHNNSASQDDEYFRATLSFRHDTYTLPDAEAAAARALERMQRKESEGFLRAFLADVKEEEIITPAGLYLGTAGSYKVDMPRLISVVERVTRGLFFHHTKSRLPERSIVKVYPVESFRNNLDVTSFQRIAEMVMWASSAPHHETAGKVLSYKFRQTDQDPAASVWMMMFYDAVPFLVVTATPKPAV